MKLLKLGQYRCLNGVRSLCLTNNINTLGRPRPSAIHQQKYSTGGFQEEKIDVNGIDINYVQGGNGEHAVLCLPGALGSIWSDFKPQIEGLNKTKFTVVAWDPPGYGNSRPPDRDFTGDFFHQDASFAVQLMKNLNLKKFSLLGWSDGGITAMIIAGKYPENIEKMVIWGANAYIVDEEIKIYKGIRDVRKWSERMRAPLVKLYGEQYFADTWSRWVDAFLRIHAQGGDLCKSSLPLIRCPTLVAHGNKDPMIATEHPTYLINNIKNAKLHVFEDGKHNIHLRYAKEFNKIVEDFLSQH